MCITEDGKCDLCGRKVALEEEKKRNQGLMLSELTA
jgi:CRISPR/Cas system-associated protein Cas10 (large subunit of type III CRISPR-Cas system)